MVGPTEVEAYDNPTGEPVYPGLPVGAYESVFDFGCGCGRLARRLFQQEQRPGRYLGVDLHPAMIAWCQENLTPATGFEFRHHDVAHPTRNPGPDKPRSRPLEGEDGGFTFVLAHSVFTHLVQADAEYYLSEAARLLAPEGILLSTWFLFDKASFPMMQDFQNALYINEDDPTNAVIFDRDWLRVAARAAGLTISLAQPPDVRGFQWIVEMRPAGAGAAEADIPSDEAPYATPEDSLQAGTAEPDLSGSAPG